MDQQEQRIMRSIASSMQEAAQALVQINNRLAEIGKVLKDNQPTDLVESNSEGTSS